MGSGNIKWHVHCSVCGAFLEKSAQSDSEVDCKKCRSTLEVLVKDDIVSVRPLVIRDEQLKERMSVYSRKFMNPSGKKSWKMNKNEIPGRAANLAGTIKTAPDIKSLSRSWIWLESLRARQNICNWSMESFSILYDHVHLFCRFFYFFQDPCCIRTLETLDR